MTASGETKILHTKENVRNALIQMLISTDIDKITIKELCRISQINRTTFYKYYGSQYDVLNEIATIYTNKTADLLLNDLNSGRKIEDNLIAALQFIKENAAFFNLFLNNSNTSLTSSIITTLPSFDSFIMSSMNQKLSDNEKKYLAAFVLYGSIKIIADWVLDGCALSCKSIGSLILTASGKVIGA
ncbi:MAG: TetR/AcrR family transcriptional regulator [Butyrivibrio sp.]|nr:TetR/AcrR family transcriptional regulator [Butyrivibrio sp.]